MSKQVLIIHGWSDNSRSFNALADFLIKNNYSSKEIRLSDYTSKDDDVRVADVAARMANVIDQMMASGELAQTFDAIVHSTGALVARTWLTQRYQGKAENSPMKRLIMLAPANYGSKLAAAGKSFLGRVGKGYDNWFHTGQSMLNDLELSSDFLWKLAQRDVIIPPGGDTARYYGADRVWPFVIVGTYPYPSLLRQIVNEDGADGTVRVCAANLNASGVTINFGESDPEKMITLWESRLDCEVPLAVLPTRTHSSIIDPERANRSNKEDISETEEEKKQLGKLILQALDCDTFAQYQAIQQEWDGLTEMTCDRKTNPPSGADAEYFHQYMQVNTCVKDDHGKPVTDYFMEFFSDTSKKNDEANVYLHTKVIEDVKVNTIDESLRNMYFDRTDLMEVYYKGFTEGLEPILFMSISAASPGNNVKYFSSDKEGAEGCVPVHVEGDKTKRWLRRNTTHFVNIIIPRRPVANVFKLR